MTTASPRPARGLVRFGRFALDLRSEELRRDGDRVAIPRQSVQALALLLERPGELVSRDALCRGIWPDGTYVDFEHGLNAAVKRLRDALGDSAEAPLFVETLARRGYRFIARVEKPVDADPHRAGGRSWRSRPIVLVAAGLAAAYVLRAFRLK